MLLLPEPELPRTQTRIVSGLPVGSVGTVPPRGVGTPVGANSRTGTHDAISRASRTERTGTG
ncbi:hypothetical protein GCM10022379_11960 [Micromonospora maritima]